MTHDEFAEALRRLVSETTVQRPTRLPELAEALATVLAHSWYMPQASTLWAYLQEAAR